MGPRWRRRSRRALSWLGAAAAILGGIGVRAQGAADFERPPISYSRTAPHDAVARLVRRIAAGEIALAGSDPEILRTVLRELNIPVQSQVVVFSRTSLQAGLIRPDHPRALYFSDSVYVGWVPGGLIEAAAIDPELGPVFYAFDPQDVRDARRSFVRETTCLRCHGGSFVPGIPGLFARSLVTARNGEPLSEHDAEVVDDQTPFQRLWGGWYVTGYAGKPNHRGNAFGVERGDRVEFSPADRRPEELSDDFDTSSYLAATSDVVALLIFQHQLAMHNSLTRAAHTYRRMLDAQRSAQVPSSVETRDGTTFDRETNVLAGAAEDVLDHLLFRNAAPLPEGVKGSADFRRVFTAGVPRSRSGAALKDLSLQGRLFTNRCSFLIYSESFSALPAPLKDRIFDRLYTALHDEDPQGRYAYLEKDEKHRILDVLNETHPDAHRRFQAFEK